jgi:hypothetical protein
LIGLDHAVNAVRPFHYVPSEIGIPPWMERWSSQCTAARTIARKLCGVVVSRCYDKWPFYLRWFVGCLNCSFRVEVKDIDWKKGVFFISWIRWDNFPVYNGYEQRTLLLSNFVPSPVRSCVSLLTTIYKWTLFTSRIFLLRRYAPATRRKNENSDGIPLTQQAYHL